jgi:hypothetical protein
MHTPKPANTTVDSAPKRRVLGLVVLLLTIGPAYLAARFVDPPDALVALASDAGEGSEDSLEAKPRPTRAEIDAHIEEVAVRYGIAPRLVAAIVAAESEFNPRAVSPKGAQGLMQLMPETAASLDVQDSFDARENIEGGVRHLRALLDRFRGNVPLAVAAYNAGEQAVITYRGIPPYPETRRYVIRVLRRVDREAARQVAEQISASARTSPIPRARVRLASYRPSTPVTPAMAAAAPRAGRHEVDARRDGATELYAAFARPGAATEEGVTPAPPRLQDPRNTVELETATVRATPPPALGHQGP